VPADRLQPCQFPLQYSGGFSEAFGIVACLQLKFRRLLAGSLNGGLFQFVNTVRAVGQYAHAATVHLNHAARNG
jgi:hypothetical protein